MYCILTQVREAKDQRTILYHLIRKVHANSTQDPEAAARLCTTMTGARILRTAWFPSSNISANDDLLGRLCWSLCRYALQLHSEWWVASRS